LKAIGLHKLGTNCRGGPPWPPVVLIEFTKSEAVASRTPAKTTGGHGGSPLQFVPQGLCTLLYSADCLPTEAVAQED